MRTTIRLVVLACAGVLALSFAGNALATQKIEIFQPSYALGGSARLDLMVRQDTTDAAPAKVQILVPAGYGVFLGQAAGSTVGTVEATAKAKIAGADVILPLNGPITVANPANYAAQSTACTGRPLHQAVWILQLAAAGQTLPVPVYVDAAGPAGTAATIQVCLPSPYVPESAGGARFGAQLLGAVLHTTGVFTNPADPNYYVWHLIVTPYQLGTATPNVPATVEARARVPYPYTLTLKRQKSRRRTIVVLGGTLKDATGAVPSVRVRVLNVTRATKPTSAGTARTNVRGAYKKSMRATKARRFFQAVFGPVDITASACTAPVLAPGGCVSAIQSAVKSSRVKVNGVRPRRHHR
jgi:hypothetical protein